MQTVQLLATNEPEKNLSSWLLSAGGGQKQQSGCLREGAHEFSWCCREAAAMSSPNRAQYLNAKGVNHRLEQFSLFSPHILLPAAEEAITPWPLLLSPLKGFEQKPVAKFSLAACLSQRLGAPECGICGCHFTFVASSTASH